jgi:signal transduction histidine kinase
MNDVATRLLLVEDDPDLAENLAEIVNGMGCETVVAESAERALELLETQSFAAMITDVRLPGLDGIELLQRLRSRGLLLPVVVISALAEPGVVRRAEESGALDVMHKPIDFTRLAQLVEPLVHSREHQPARIPTARSEAPREAPHSSGAVSVKRPSAAARATLLIVDDHEDLAENVAAILENGLAGVELDCSIATSAQEAIAALDRWGETLDIAFIDLRLPDADGVDLLARVKAKSPNAEVVIITGDATVESAVAAVGAGAFSYVLKPFRPADLVLTAQQALAGVRLAREGEALRRGLEQSERRHREVVEAVPAFVVALNAEGEIQLWNRRLEEVTGFPRSEMLGKPGLELVGEGARKLPLKRGGHRLVRWQRAVLPSADGEAVTYAVGVDVTEERELLRRTLRAERLAAVGTLAAGLAHEVRNPLNSATLQLRVLERRIERGSASADELLPIIGIVGEEIRRLDRLVSDFLSFAQPRPLRLEPVRVDELATLAAELARPEGAQAGIDVVVEVGAGAGTVEVDLERMRQVLLNLVRNAIEAMRGQDEGGTLTVRTFPADAAGNARIEVIDTGPGFTEDAPIFDAFFTTKEGGTGLGLAIAFRIVADHGGALHAESRPGRTRFAIELPARAER